MSIHWSRVLGILTLALLLAPHALFAQDWRRADRGNIKVTNDWERPVTVTLSKELSSQSWTIVPGQTALLAERDGRSLRVGGNDLINVGTDWGQVPIQNVGHLQGRTWYVNVRDVWQATHQGRGRSGGLPPDQPGTTRPPYIGR